MTSLTSLIRIRHAIGILLALAGIFGVALTAVTFTNDQTDAQSTNPTVTLTASPQATNEEGRWVFVLVELSEPLPAGADDLIIPIVVGAEGDTAVGGNGPGCGSVLSGEDYCYNGPDQVTIPNPAQPDRRERGFIRFTFPDDADDDEPAETFTVKLGTLPAGYDEGETTSLVITITDANSNADTTGGVTITVPDGDDLDELPDIATEGKVGQPLTADLSGVEDADYEDNSNTANVDENQLDFILQSGGNEVVSYQWIRINGTRDQSPLIQGDISDDYVGTDQKTYTPTDDDVGKSLTVLVTWLDRNGNGDNIPESLTIDTTLGPTLYNQARPIITETDVNDNDRLDPGDILTADTTGMFNAANNLIDANGAEVDRNEGDDGQDPVPQVETIANSAVTLKWLRDGEDFMCDLDNDPQTTDVACENTADQGLSYTLTDDDVASKITLIAVYSVETVNDDTGTPGDETETEERILTSDGIGRIHSTNDPTGKPSISGTGQVGQTLTASPGSIEDMDGLMNVTYSYEWFHGDAENYQNPIGTGDTYALEPTDAGETIKVVASFNDDLGDPYMVASDPTVTIAGSPGQISRIEPTIRSVTVSAGDTVTLSVDVYGLQNAKDNSLPASFEWSVGGDHDADLGSKREINFKAPSDPGRYDVTASLEPGQCQPDLDGRKDEAARKADCSATIVVHVRRPAPPVAEDEPPVNPPGDIPSILTDSDGNQYEVFTPVDGGTFDAGEGYSIAVPAGAVPNGEFIGIRMSEGGEASNIGMTHQRYALGGNTYGIHAVDGSGAAISSYALEGPARVCVPMPAVLSGRVSDLALVGINSDGSLTIHAANIRLGDNGTQVCGNVSTIPTTVAVGSQGAPDAIPTAVPDPEPDLPPTGGASPSSGAALWLFLLGIAALTLSTLAVIHRRRQPKPTK